MKYMKLQDVGLRLFFALKPIIINLIKKLFKIPAMKVIDSI